MAVAAAAVVLAKLLPVLLRMRLLAHLRMALARAWEASLTRCVPTLIALLAVAARAVVAVAVIQAVVVALAAAVVVSAVVLEATQMATRSAAGNAQAAATPVVALIAGATGLVGKELLALLLADNACREVHSLVRKPSSQQHAKLRSHVVDFATLTQRPPTLPQIDEVYICLGTTIKVAGSKEAFKAVDFDAFMAVAGIGIALGATKLGVISAMGASNSSSVFYSRVKGEMEEAVSKLGYQSVTIARPSLLAGDRESLLQASRPHEKIALLVMNVFTPLIPKNYQIVQAIDVASSLLQGIRSSSTGVTVMLSGQLKRS